MPTLIAFALLLAQLATVTASMFVILGCCFCAIFEIDVPLHRRDNLSRALMFAIGVITATAFHNILQ